MLLEICCYSAWAAKIAYDAGAHRIELCDNPGEGGTTPSYATLKWVNEHIPIPVFTIIRPRGGDFVYKSFELEIMKADILLCKSMGFQGVVLGLLAPTGEVDYEKTAQLTELAWPMEVTFHRAFDRTKEPYKALETIKKAGCSRVLTSGQRPTASEGINLIKELVCLSANEIAIMPGSGIRSTNLSEIAKTTQAVEFHSSAGIVVPSSNFSPVSMHEHIQLLQPDTEEIKAMLKCLQTAPYPNGEN
jgi:copper homeostasis protein